MKKRKETALRLSAYIIFCIILMLFFIFVLTYDFSFDKKRISDKSKDDVSLEAYDIVNESIIESYTLNTLSLDFSEDFFNDFFYAYYFNNDENDNENNEYILKTEYWTIKNINFGFKNDEFIIYLYVGYHNKIKYNLKIKAFFNFDERVDSFNFNLKKLVIGSLIIPESFVRNTLSKTKEDTIGSIFNNMMSALPLGTYDKETLSLAIHKKELQNSIENGFIGDLISKSSEDIKKIIMPFSYLLLRNNLMNFSIKKGTLSIKLNYSMFVNNENSLSYENDIEALKGKSYRDYKAIEYDLLLKNFLGYDTIYLNQYYLNALYLKNIYKEYSKGSDDYVALEFANISLRDDELKLTLTMNFFDKLSAIEYYFIRASENNYKLDCVEIGRDYKEGTSSYIKVSDSEGKNQFLKLLYEFGFDEDVNRDSFTLDSIFDASILNINKYTIEDNEIIIELEDFDNEKIKNAILGDDFNNDISLKGIDYSDADTLIKSFMALSTPNKEIYFKKIKEYFKDDILMYNYIEKFIN